MRKGWLGGWVDGWVGGWVGRWVGGRKPERDRRPQWRGGHEAWWLAGRVGGGYAMMEMAILLGGGEGGCEGRGVPHVAGR